jgi:hypothetical protein
MKKTYVVRVVTDSDTAKYVEAGPFLECLRYAGLIQVHRASPSGFACFDLLPPATHQAGSKQWAEMNAERMSSYGFNAVVAPKWGDE